MKKQRQVAMIERRLWAPATLTNSLLSKNGIGAKLVLSICLSSNELIAVYAKEVSKVIFIIINCFFVCFVFTVDINECIGDPAALTCHVNADCINTNGSYTCQCMSGYIGNGMMCFGKVLFLHSFFQDSN